MNDCYKSDKFGRIQILPFYLVQMISLYVSNEVIYLLERGEGTHWKMNADDILNNVEFF